GPTFYTDVFVTRLPLAGGPPTYSTYFGGISFDSASALALDSTGAAVVTGKTLSSSFPTQNAFQSTFGGGGGTFPGGDAFVSRIEIPPPGVSPYGTSSPGCAGPLAIDATSSPQVGNAGFAVTCDDAPQNAAGLLGFSGAPLASPLGIVGVQVWIDPASPQFFSVLTISNGAGDAQVPIPIPAVPSLAGGQAYLQFFWFGLSVPSPPCPPSGFSASNALAITVQP
ncbi:MAG TPA: hypothetical protein VKF62_07525, partial [Planctomycetota bacterium]|nr:hypothetical protein [Planctomycetota bacterium]